MFAVRLLLALLLLAAALPASAQLHVVDAGLSPAEQAASRRLTEEALQRLPPRWRAGLPSNLALRWRDDLPAQVHGRTTGAGVGLQRDLLQGWMARDATTAVTTDPGARAALAALLHELAHAYERNTQHPLARDPRLLDLAGWQQRPLRLGLRVRHNPFTDRSPDRYELTDPDEYVAVNLEWFLLDPEYACRRPALAQLFAAHFEWTPPAAACAPGLPFLQADADFASQGFDIIDPARVYAIDYLLAEANDAQMSRWGHSMLHLVICAPDRAPGPDCRLDLQYHRVLSFRAFVGDVQLSSWRGLTGRYPSRLFLLPLDQVIDEYTKIELRGLRSIPLRLSQAEITGILTRAAQLHWSYDGRYFFISNNCAVETWRLLREGAPRLSALPLRSVTPTGLLRRLQKQGVADAGVLGDPDAAQRQGFYFASMGPRYRQMFAQAQTALALPQSSLEDWLALPPAQRAPWLTRADLPTTAALLLLEQAAQRQAELRVRDALKRRLLAGDATSRAARAQVQTLLLDEALLLRPSALGDAGYGLPQGERATLEAAAKAKSTAVAAQWTRLREQARAALPSAQQQALAGIDANLATLGARLRQLNRAQGGLELR